VLEVKERQTALLLLTLRKELFAEYSCKYEFQGEMLEVYMVFRSAEWIEWCEQEVKHCSWLSCPSSRLSYVQTESLQPVPMAGLLDNSANNPDAPKRTDVFWGSGMTKEPAMASLILGILQ
jgi:hypothetical protein